MASGPTRMRGPKTFDPSRAQQLLQDRNPLEALDRKPSMDRKEQLKALGFTPDGEDGGDSEEDEEEEEENHFYAPRAGPNAGHSVPSAKLEELNGKLKQITLCKSNLEKQVENLENKLGEEMRHKHQTLDALKAAEEQVAMLKTSSHQQLTMLKRERELIMQQAQMAGAAPPKSNGTVALASGADTQRISELEAENRRLKSQAGSNGEPQSDPNNEEVEMLTSRVQQQQAELDERTKNLQAAQDQIHQHQQALQELQQTNQSQASSDTSAAEESKAQSIRKEMQAEISRLEAKLSSEAELVAQQAQEKEQHFARELSRLKQEAEESQSKLKESVAAAERNSGQRVSKLEAKLAEASARAEEAEAKVSELSGQAGRHQAELDAMQAKYRKECKLRKKLHNTLADLKGQIRVFCRVRPLSQKETDKCQGEQAVSFPEDDMLVLATSGGDKEFEFDRVFSQKSAQSEIFEDTEPLVTSVLDGYNVCIFAYGQTGSGKTHTMEGPESDPGVNLRALGELFRLVGERQEEEITIQTSLLEIYNETIVDLLVANGKDQKLDIRQGPDGVHVPDLSLIHTKDMKDVGALIHTGKKNRTTFATNMNEHSSRSHSILSISVTSRNTVTDVVTKGKLHLVDLAGSERISKTEAQGDRLKEAQAINKSLSALGDVIAALTNRSPHIPYRNSKLTYLLQDSLGGNSKTMMFVNINPAPENVQESTCSLNFAQRVRSVEQGPAQKQVSGGDKTPSRPVSSKSLKSMA